jgi:hypothetical protein
MYALDTNMKARRYSWGCQAVAGLVVVTIGMLLFFGLGVIGFIKGVPDILHQHEALTTWKPVEARVMSADSAPEAQPNRGFRFRIVQAIVNAVSGEDYVVWVSYRYKVDGMEYVSGEENPVGLRFIVQAWNLQEQWTGQVGAVSGRAKGPEAWARKTLAGFVPGAPCQAYFDPHDPSKSFLLKEYDFSPYSHTLLSLLFVLLVTFLFTLMFEAAYRPNPVPIPGLTLLVRLILALGYAGTSGWALVQYWVHSSEPLARGWSPIGWAIASGLLSVLSLLIALLIARNDYSRRTDPV